MMNNIIEILICIDTTGSMYPCLTQVRRYVEELVMSLFSDIRNLRIGFIAHGDYCDAQIHGSYVTKILDLTDNPADICNFLRTVGPTNGGDLPECYELVLHEARTKISWTAGATKVILMIGDNVPHGPHERQNYLHLDWRNELNLLLEAAIHVYGVHALGRHHTRAFYQEIAMETGGYCLELDQFHHVHDLVKAVCLMQAGDDHLREFEQEVTDAGRMDGNLDSIFATLSGRERRSEFFAPKGLEPVPAGRFQVLDVDDDQSIRDFVEENGLTFKTGRGFYEFTKTETVQERKEVVLLHEASGAMFSGAKAREMIGLPFGVRGRIRPNGLEGYTCFIQSTSYNRKLKGGTRFLYEVEEWSE